MKDTRKKSGGKGQITLISHSQTTQKKKKKPTILRNSRHSVSTKEVGLSDASEVTGEVLKT